MAIFFQLKRVIESDAAMAEDTLPYNIIPLDAPSLTNPIASFPEVIWFSIYFVDFSFHV